MKLVVISDIHDGGISTGDASFRHVNGPRLLLRRAIARINRFVKPDLVAVLGDLVERGDAFDAPERYDALFHILDELQPPWCAIPGNHDAPPAIFYRHIPRPPERWEAAGVRVLPFLDTPTASYQATRRPEDLERARSAGEGWDGPIVALHHVPLFPPGAHSCPYNYTNAEDALSAYHAGGIGITIAGHYHAGFGPLACGTGWSLAVPALAVPPFRFWELEIERGAPPRLTEHELRLPDGLPLGESHVHTEFAYCADDISIEAALEVCALVGVCAPAFAEHSGQLYFDRETFWSAAFMDKGLSTKEGRVERVSSYLERAAAVGLSRQRVGFETDFDFHGRPVLEAADRAAAGFIIGSYHWTPETAACRPFDSHLCAERHRRVWERMLSSGLEVLAHPFRVWSRAGVPPPPGLFAELADRLGRARVAAELNFHLEVPSAEFAVACLERGVPFSLGTDSHALVNVGDFWPHLQFLARLGIGAGDLERVLWQPDGRGPLTVHARL